MGGSGARCCKPKAVPDKSLPPQAGPPQAVARRRLTWSGTEEAAAALPERGVHASPAESVTGMRLEVIAKDKTERVPRFCGREMAEAVEIPTGEPPPNEESEQGDEEETAARTRQLGAGDAEAFKHLFDTYFDRLYRYVFRYLQSADESQDVVHDVFLQIWRQRRRIGLERDLRTYLYATARNRALDHLKHRRVEERFRERRAAVLAAEEGVGPAPSPERELESRELAAAIQKAIDSLPRRQREVLELRWQGTLSYEEVAKLLGISPKTVAVHLTRALQHLRETLPGFLE